MRGDQPRRGGGVRELHDGARTAAGCPSEAAAARFAPVPASVADARRFVSEVLGTEPGAPLVLLLVSELATNAVVHGKGAYEIRVVPGDRVRVEVWDEGLERPHRVAVGAEATSGRGLRIVEELATAWGVEPLAGGKVVWFEV